MFGEALVDRAQETRDWRRDDAVQLAVDEKRYGTAFVTLDGRRVDPSCITPVYADGHRA